jgi:hypothetical protein
MGCGLANDARCGRRSRLGSAKHLRFELSGTVVAHPAGVPIETAVAPAFDNVALLGCQTETGKAVSDVAPGVAVSPFPKHRAGDRLGSLATNYLKPNLSSSSVP